MALEAACEIDTSVPKGERCGPFVSSVRPSFDLTEWLSIGSSFVISRAYGAPQKSRSSCNATLCSRQRFAGSWTGSPRPVEAILPQKRCREAKL
jgi:hypothetical protein